jgi:hypothetical protein
MVSYMSDIPPRATGDPLASRVQPQIRNILIFQARKYLEDRFVQPRFIPSSGNTHFSILGREFFDQLKDCQPLKDSARWS